MDQDRQLPAHRARVGMAAALACCAASLALPFGADAAETPGNGEIFFIRGNPGEGRLYAIDADGSDLHQVLDAPGTIDTLAVSPDGSKIVFSGRPYKAADGGS